MLEANSQAVSELEADVISSEAQELETEADTRGRAAPPACPIHQTVNVKKIKSHTYRCIPYKHNFTV